MRVESLEFPQEAAFRACNDNSKGIKRNDITHVRTDDVLAM